MTDEERRQLKDIHDALFKPPHGGGEPLIQRLVNAVNAYEQGSAIFRFFIRSFMGLSGLTAAWIVLRDFIFNKGV